LADIPSVRKLIDSGVRGPVAPVGIGPVGPGRDSSGPGEPLQDKPDLTVLDVWTVPTDFCPQATVDMHGTIHNLGLVAVVDSFYFDMWFDGENIGYARIEGLGAGASLELVLEDFVWPADSDSHVVTAMADTDYEIDEEVEVNNLRLEYFQADVCTTCTEVSIPLEPGWNWFSLNVSDADMSLDHVLASLDTNGIYIKNQTSFADYVPAWGGWFGTLGEITCDETYMLKMENQDTLAFCGFPYDVSTAMNLPPGWSWISYLPFESMTLDDALASLGSSGEYIKDQTSFADYVPEWNGWFGSLSEMKPLCGYKIKMTLADTLIYPEGGGTLSGNSHRRSLTGCLDGYTGDWVVNPHDFEANSGVIAALGGGGKIDVGAGDRIGVFCGAQCRGTAAALLTPEGAHLFYITVYGSDRERDVLTLKYWNARSEMVYLLDREVVFQSDAVLGSSIRPLRLAISGPAERDRSTGLEACSLFNRPDPFAEITTVMFQVTTAGPVTVEVYNTCGEKVATLMDGDLEPDTYRLTWDGTTDSGRTAPSGVYFCRAAAGNTVLTDKVILMR
jgi:hypothetical protein